MMQIKTKDADEAAFFWVQEGTKLVGTECKNGYNKKILWFVFETEMIESEVEELKTDYRNGKTLVEPKSYAAKRAQIKNLIRENIFQ